MTTSDNFTDAGIVADENSIKFYGGRPNQAIVLDDKSESKHKGDPDQTAILTWTWWGDGWILT